MLLCTHRNPPADLMLLASMDSVHANSRKRTNGLNGLSSETECQCTCHDEHGPPSSKRQKPQRPLRAPPHSEALPEPISGSSRFLLGESSDTTTWTNTDINPFGDVFSVFPPAPSPDLQPYLSYQSQQFLRQNVGTANNTAETSVSCTVTNDTFSPRSWNRQVVLDTNGCATPSPNIENEFLFDSSDNFSPEAGNDLLWDASDLNLLTFSGSGRSSPVLVLHFLTILRCARAVLYL